MGATSNVIAEALTKSGVTKLWSIIKSTFVAKEEGKGLSTEDFTSTLKTKLDGVAEGATKVLVDEEVNSTSTNAIQNKAVDAAITASASSTLSSAKEYTDGKVTGVYRYAGSVESEDDLPEADSEGLQNGDVYDIQTESSYGAAGMNVAYNATTKAWDALGGKFAISAISDEDIAAICV